MLVCQEIQLALLLLPLLQMDLSSHFSPRVEHSDACMTGIGRSWTHLSVETVQSICRMVSSKGTYTNLQLPGGFGLDSEGKCPLKKVD